MILVLAPLLLTLYAVADWWRTDESEMPGGLARPMWLVLILITFPMFSLGALAWILLRIISRADAADANATGNLRPWRGRGRRTEEPTAPVAPDDDPDFLFRLEREIRRKRANEAEQGGSTPPTDEGGTRFPREDEDGPTDFHRD